ncbi:unnamed protein product [Gadus morhua 'NCC']
MAASCTINSTCKEQQEVAHVEEDEMSARSSGPANGRKGALVWRRKRSWDLASVARAVMLERAPKVMVRQDIPRLEVLTGKLKQPLAFSSMRGQVFSILLVF